MWPAEHLNLDRNRSFISGRLIAIRHQLRQWSSRYSCQFFYVIHSIVKRILAKKKQLLTLNIELSIEIAVCNIPKLRLGLYLTMTIYVSPQSCRTGNRKIVGKIHLSLTRATSTTTRSRSVFRVCVCVCVTWVNFHLSYLNMWSRSEREQKPSPFIISY